MEECDLLRLSLLFDFWINAAQKLWQIFIQPPKRFHNTSVALGTFSRNLFSIPCSVKKRRFFSSSSCLRGFFSHLIYSKHCFYLPDWQYVSILCDLTPPFLPYTPAGLSLSSSPSLSLSLSVSDNWSCSPPCRNRPSRLRKPTDRPNNQGSFGAHR